MLRATAQVRDAFPDVQLVAGNVATREGAQALVERGVDAVKVGVGPGSICTTRVVTGVGVPQLTAIFDAVEGAGDVPVIADGGIKYSGDIVKALAAGASSVMMGSMLAGTEESPGESFLLEGRRFKMIRGMGSLAAMQDGSADRYFQEGEMSARRSSCPRASRDACRTRARSSDVLFQMVGGLRSGMGYVGCASIDELRTETEFVRITTAGLRESHPHDVTITREAPNYSGVSVMGALPWRVRATRLAASAHLRTLISLPSRSYTPLPGGSTCACPFSLHAGVPRGDRRMGLWSKKSIAHPAGGSDARKGEHSAQADARRDPTSPCSASARSSAPASSCSPGRRRRSTPGPRIVLSFMLAGFGCLFAGLCYAEFASMIPIAGSAYTYGYATLGEFIAWIIGWDLMLEYLFGASTVAVGWSATSSRSCASSASPLPDCAWHAPAPVRVRATADDPGCARHGRPIDLNMPGRWAASSARSC